MVQLNFLNRQEFYTDDDNDNNDDNEKNRDNNAPGYDFFKLINANNISIIIVCNIVIHELLSS